MPIVLAIRPLLSRFGLSATLVGAGRLAFLFLILVAGRTAEAGAFGLFMVALAASQILASICSLGTGPASQAIIGEARGLGRTHRIASYIRFAIRTTSVGAAAATLALAAIGIGLGTIVPGSDAAAICFATAIFVPAMAASALREFVARALEEQVLAFAPRDIVWTLACAFLLLVFPPLRAQLLPVVSAVLIGVEAIAWTILWRRRIVPLGDPKRRLPVRAYRRWRARSGSMMANLTAGIGFERIDVLAVGFFTSLPVAGVYGAASRIAPLVSIGQRFVVPVITPRLASAQARQDRQALATELRHGAVATSLVAIPAYLLVLLFADPIMRVFGPGFAEGANILRLLATAHLAVAICSTFAAAVIVAPQTWLYARTIWTAFIPTALLLVIVTPLGGSEAAAATVALGMIFYNLRFVLLARRLCAALP